MKLRYEALRSVAKLLAKGGLPADYQAAGVSNAEMAAFVGENLWIAEHRGAMRRVFEAVCEASLRMVGVAPFTLPAEAQAAVIALLVHPSNVWIACRWFETSRLVSVDRAATGSVVAPDEIDQFEAVTARQLFALVVMAHEDDAFRTFASLLESRTGIAIAAAYPPGQEGERERP